MLTNLDKAPFPWFGGKSRAAETVWALLGDPDHYVEPFAGAHAGTRQPGVTSDLPHISTSGQGVNRPQTRQPGVTRQLPHLSDDGQGVNRPQTRQPGVAPVLDPHEYHPLVMPELERWFAHLSARLRHVRILNGDWARTVTTGAAHTLPVRQGGVAGIFLDPPYDLNMRNGSLYATDADDTADETHPAARCLQWCLDLPDDPKWRVVLAGYEGEHNRLEDNGWTVHEWFTPGHLSTNKGGLQGKQAGLERLWAAPHCLDPAADDHQQQSLWGGG